MRKKPPLPLGLRKPTQEELKKQKNLSAQLFWFMTEEKKEGIPPSVRAELDIAPEEKQQFREFYRRMQKDLGHCIRWNNWNNKERFFTIFALYGPRVLAADPFNPGKLLIDLEVLWRDAQEDDKKAKELLLSMGKALAWVGLGRTALPGERKKKNRDRQRRAREKDTAAEVRLREAITAAKEKLPLSIQRDWKKRRMREAEIEDSLIANALASPDPHQQKAGRKFKKRLERERGPLAA